MHQKERETLRQAAVTAKTLADRLIRQRERLDERIKALLAVVRAWEAMSGRPLPGNTAAEPVPHGRQEPPRGSIASGIRAILREGKPLTWEEIREEFEKRLGWAPPKATIFSTLRRLRMKGRVTNVDGRWAWNEPGESDVDMNNADSTMHNGREQDDELPPLLRS